MLELPAGAGAGAGACPAAPEMGSAIGGAWPGIVPAGASGVAGAERAGAALGSTCIGPR